MLNRRQSRCKRSQVAKAGHRVARRSWLIGQMRKPFSTNGEGESQFPQKSGDNWTASQFQLKMGLIHFLHRMTITPQPLAPAGLQPGELIQAALLVHRVSERHAPDLAPPHPADARSTAPNRQSPALGLARKWAPRSSLKVSTQSDHAAEAVKHHFSRRIQDQTTSFQACDQGMHCAFLQRVDRACLILLIPSIRQAEPYVVLHRGVTIPQSLEDPCSSPPRPLLRFF